MSVAKNGDRVTIHYVGTLDNGGVFDSADQESPLSFTLGQGEVFPALEAAVTGLTAGAAANIEILAAQAYGPHRPENMLRVPRGQFRPNANYGSAKNFPWRLPMAKSGS